MSLINDFSYDIIGTVDSLCFTADIPPQEVYLNPEAGIDAFLLGLPIFREMTSGLPVSVPYTTPVIKYGHLHELGLPLCFPEEGQVAPGHLSLSLDEIDEHIKNVDFNEELKNRTELTRNQFAYLESMRNTFSERVSWGWQWEGPLTSVWALMGTSFFTQFYDDPEKLRRVLINMSRSISSYVNMYCKIDGISPADPFPDHGRLCDDLAAMISPEFWSEFVVPSWSECFSSSFKSRKVHCEGMVKEHLSYLGVLEVNDFDSGISSKLNPDILNKNIKNIPFCWRLGSFHYEDMTIEDIRQFVYHSAAAGVRNIFTIFEPIMCNPLMIEKVRSFHSASEDVIRILTNKPAGMDRKKAISPLIDESWKWENWGGFNRPY